MCYLFFPAYRSRAQKHTCFGLLWLTLIVSLPELFIACLPLLNLVCELQGLSLPVLTEGSCHLSLITSDSRKDSTLITYLLPHSHKIQHSIPRITLQTSQATEHQIVFLPYDLVSWCPLWFLITAQIGFWV